jgi:hypothetical protein
VSERADVSAGTASGLPRFPSATATLRSSPRRFPRFTGDFLNRRENSARSTPVDSIGSAPCTSGRGQTASPLVSRTSSGELCGQTSWEFCRFNVERTAGR